MTDSSEVGDGVSESWAKLLRIVMNAGPRPVRPSIVLIHGGWIGPEVFCRVIPRLEKSGYSVIAPKLPSSGAQPALASFDEDVQIIRHTVQSLIDTGKDVVVVMHSYGAVPACEAMKYFEKQEAREATNDGYKEGRVIKLVFLTAMVLPVGGSTWASKKSDKYPGFELKDGLIHVLDARTRFYNDLSEEDAAFWISKLKSQSRPAYASQLTYPAYRHFSSAYLITTNDNALPSKVQKRFVMEAGILDVATVNAGHSPQLSEPGVVANFIRKCAGESFASL